MNSVNGMASEDLSALEKAVDLLEQPNRYVQTANAISSPIGSPAAYVISKLCPAIISDASYKAVHTALQVALMTLDHHDLDSGNAPPESSDRWHMAGAAASGALGGFFGLWGLPFELTMTTGIMMRSIAEVAQSEGANLKNLETQLECVQVLAMGGPSGRYDGAEANYFSVRRNMARTVNDAAVHIALNGLAEESAPALVRLINEFASRFSVQVTNRAAAQLLPVIGAATGSAINIVFTDHFQNIARGHFIVRRLESVYAADTVCQAYESIKGGLKPQLTDQSDGRLEFAV